MTIKDIIDNLPDWIKRVEKLKGFSNTLISRGWNWDHLYINGDNAIKLLFEYHYNKLIIPVEVKLANPIFQANKIDLDLKANIPTEKMKQDELIKIRLMYLIWWVHNFFLVNINQIKNNPSNPVIIEVENTGEINVRA